MIVLAGQGTKLFSLRERIKSLFRGKPIVDRFQESAVARGLGIYLQTLTSGAPMATPLLVNVYGKAIGIRCISELPSDNVMRAEIPSKPELNVQRLVVLPSDTKIPNKKVGEVVFQEGAVTMTISPIEVFGEGRKTSFGNLVLERTTDTIKSLYIFFSVWHDFTVILEIAVIHPDKTPVLSTWKIDLDNVEKLYFQLNNLHNLPNDQQVVEEGLGSLDGLRCVESDFRPFRRDPEKLFSSLYARLRRAEA